jgi:hypothetical protein
MYDDERLCLFLPCSGEWDSTKYLAETVLPWTCEWLFHYEVWLATGGMWCGGGSHPSKAKPARRSREQHQTTPTPRDGASFKARPST